MKLMEIVQLVETFQKEQNYPEIVYLLSKRQIFVYNQLAGSRLLQIRSNSITNKICKQSLQITIYLTIQKSEQQQNTQHQIPTVLQMKQNLMFFSKISKNIRYQDDIYNSFLKDNLRINVDYIYISEQIWKHLNTLYDGYCIKRQLRNSNQINEFIIFHFIPVYQTQSHFIEGIQQFDSSWNISQIISHLENALQNQLSVQTPKRNFISLYTLKNENQTSFIQIIQEVKEKRIEVEKIEELAQMSHKKYIILDIKLLNKGFFFEKNQQINQDNSEILLNQEYIENCRRGLSLFENQQTLLSCMLKCYENIDIIRSEILCNFTQKYKNLKQIIQESYYGFTDYVYYDLMDYEFLEEKLVVITKSRYDAVYIYNKENRIIINNQRNIKQLVESLLIHPQLQCDFNSVLFECSNEYYTEEIDFAKPAYNLKEGYKYQLRKLMWQERNINNEDRIEIRVHQCTYENIGYQSYKPFAPILKCYISQQAKFQDLHILIANLFEEVNFENYKESRLNKKYSLFFQTDQQGSIKCTFCQQKLCNNCQVPFNDKALKFGRRVINIFVVYEDMPSVTSAYQPEIIDNYFLREYFEVDWAQDKILILNINQEQIKPYNIKYYFDSRITYLIFQIFISYKELLKRYHKMNINVIV